MKNPFDLTGKIICVTGGSRGIGEEISKVLAEYGAHVIIASRNLEKCEKVANEIMNHGGKATAMRCDLSNIDDIRQLIQEIGRSFNRLDILINNAGASITKPSLEITVEDWDTMFDVNIKGLFFACQEAAKLMIEQNYGKIINVSSIGGIRTFKRIAPYGASKAGVIHLTKSLASEWARYGIYVNGIAPGLISTDMNTEQIQDERLFNKMLKMIPLRRLGKPTDIAMLALYLCSDVSNFMTGQTISVDGGVTSE